MRLIAVLRSGREVELLPAEGLDLNPDTVRRLLHDGGLDAWLETLRPRPHGLPGRTIGFVRADEIAQLELRDA